MGKGCPLTTPLPHGNRANRLCDVKGCGTKKGIELAYIQPGKPAQNAYIERFNRTYREEVLDLYLFEDLAEVRQITERWLEEYNAIRPHDALGGLTLYAYAAAQGNR